MMMFRSLWRTSWQWQSTKQFIAYTEGAAASLCVNYSQSTSTTALRPKKNKSNRKELRYFVDSKRIRTIGGKGGNGNISFLQLWCNEHAGPDGGDGGNGGHVLIEAATNTSNLNHVDSVIQADEGEKGGNKACHGKSAKHKIVKVPIGTIIRDELGVVVGDLYSEGMMFVAARGGTGGKGNMFFASSKETFPRMCENGPKGEDHVYLLEMRCMAHIGLIGFPNAGKSTLFNVISRARSKVAPHAFTTVQPHIGMVPYKDHKQLAFADLPGLIEGSHRNKGLGIRFLKHVERCPILLFIIDISLDEPWEQYIQLLTELRGYSEHLLEDRTQIVVANKVDLPEAKENLDKFKAKAAAHGVPVIVISAKKGENISALLTEIRTYYENYKKSAKETQKCS